MYPRQIALWSVAAIALAAAAAHFSSAAPDGLQSAGDALGLNAETASQSQEARSPWTETVLLVLAASIAGGFAFVTNRRGKKMAR